MPQGRSPVLAPVRVIVPSQPIAPPLSIKVPSTAPALETSTNSREDTFGALVN